MSQHTPGPWVVREIEGAFHGTKAYAIDFNEDEEQVVDYVYTEADAKLIASAPDLLDALETVVADMAPTYHDCIDDGIAECAWCIARKALVKARGDQ